MSDYEILYGPALSDRIRRICSRDSVDCAVAFLSGAVRDDLFPRWKNQTVRFVCDISMGCNSQSALKAFGAPKNVNLKVRDGLHGKIYVSDFGAIVSSANASLNEVGLTNRPAEILKSACSSTQTRRDGSTQRACSNSSGRRQ